MFKNSGKLLVMVFSLLTMVVGCGDDESALLESSEKELEFSASRSSQEVEIRSNCSWEVEVSGDWCTVTPQSGKGNGKIEVSVTKNSGKEERTATIVLLGKSKGVDNVVIRLKQSSIVKMRQITVSASPSDQGTVSGGGTYESGETVTLTATPSAGYQFIKWSDDVTTNPRTIQVTSDQKIIAHFAPLYQVTLSASPSDKGTVSGGGAYKSGESAILKATPADGYLFTKWSDGVTTNPRTFLVNAPATLTAYFAQLYQLTVSASPSNAGTISGAGAYELGKTVTLTATSSSGYRFAKWSDGITDNPRTVKVTGNQTLTAYFAQLYQLTVSASPSNTGTVSGGGAYESGETVTLMATPSYGYQFVKWSDGVTDNPRTVKVTGNKTITAYFDPLYKVTISVSPSNKGTVSGGGAYESGEAVTLTATPSYRYQFVKWSDGVTTNPRTITVTGDKTLTAFFETYIVEGKLPGKFSVSASKKVYFSMGNLQYRAITKEWRFAENQYDIIGDGNAKVSASYSGWIDLFGWGTSGYNGKYPYMTSKESSDYGYGNNDIAGTNYDWGVYKAISNGGNKAGLWRTLTKAEWAYLYKGRTNAMSLRGRATVNGVAGYVLLPDDWGTPSGLSFTANPGDYTTNSYSITDWNKMESVGALFLPAAGYRNGTSVRVLSGYYWSSTYDDSNYAYFFYFNSGNAPTCEVDYRYYGCSVRLVRE